MGEFMRNLLDQFWVLKGWKHLKAQILEEERDLKKKKKMEEKKEAPPPDLFLFFPIFVFPSLDGCISSSIYVLVIFLRV